MGYFMRYIIEFPMAVALTSALLPSRIQPKEQRRSACCRHSHSKLHSSCSEHTSRRVVQMSPRAVCILSAVGAVAIVDMCLAGYFGCGVLRYEKKKPLGLLPMVAASGGEFQQIRLTSWVAPNGRNKRRRVLTNQTVINSDVYMNLEVSSGSMVIVEIFFRFA
ncbi:uncharacterized protein LOC131298849 isoform X2 [Rhododendron vialii]|uniref:uncharacterized protein LOC131298849 isoform X2 n=1 Tax=Rhododendron vialii TaxID=182163 RepID=UPI00265F1F53|nr:uncharacterized protein LOC131298849 isoform X2 [Rhododendron vialii]